MANLHKHFGWAVLASELSHIFCCVLPTMVTLLGVLSNIGIITASPGFVMLVHDYVHAYEVPIIIFSGGMVALGWIVHMASRNIDCHNTGCVHPPCGEKKRSNSKVLIVATILFAANVLIYFGIHQNMLDIDLFAASKPHHSH